METKPYTRKTSTRKTSTRRPFTRSIRRLLLVVLAATLFAAAALAPTADARQAQLRSRQQPVRTPAPAITTVSDTSEIDLAVDKALASPSLITVLTAHELTRAAQTTAGIGQDFVAETQEMVRDSALTTQPEFGHLFDRSLQHLFVGAPTYTEPIVVTQTQVLVDRTITFELAPNACTKETNRRSLGDLCFSVARGDEMPEDVEATIAEMRASLDRANDRDQVAPGISVAQAQAMNDDDLLELSLNTGPRSIRRLTTLPRSANGNLIDLDELDELETLVATSATAAEHIGGVAIDQAAVVDPYNFDTQYLLTGFTYSRHYGEKWEYEKDAWWHPRVYLSFSYDFTAGFGIRAPFSVDVNYVSGDATQSNVAVSVDPVSLDVAAAHVGLPADKYFDGNEFVLEVNFDCELYGSIAGWSRSYECDDLFSIDTSLSRDFDPVIGNEVRNVNRIWLWEDGKSPVRAELLGGALFAELNLGVGLNIKEGRFAADIEASGAATVTGVDTSGPTWFENRNSQMVTVTGSDVGTHIGAGGGMTISDPRYSFKAAITPRVKLTAGIDYYIEKNWSFGFDLDFFEIGARFSLGAHEGTDTELDYHMFGSDVLVAVEDFNLASSS